MNIELICWPWNLMCTLSVWNSVTSKIWKWWKALLFGPLTVMIKMFQFIRWMGLLRTQELAATVCDRPSFSFPYSCAEQTATVWTDSLIWCLHQSWPIGPVSHLFTLSTSSLDACTESPNMNGPKVYQGGWHEVEELISYTFMTGIDIHIDIHFWNG